MISPDRLFCAFLFPGTGVPLSGFEATFFERNHTVLEPFLADAGTYAGIDFIKILQQDAIDTLPERENQIFAYAFSCAMHKTFTEKGMIPVVAAGYSMGIYAALVAAGAISFHNGLRTLDTAYQLMKPEAALERYGMGVVIGLIRDELERLCFRYGNQVCIVNSNNVTCHIISGLRETVQDVLTDAQNCGALKCSILSVNIPYHFPVLKKLRDPFSRFLESESWNPASFPIISSIDQKILINPSELTFFVLKNLYTPINWHQVIEKIISEGIDMCVECGPGLSLTKNGHFYSEHIHFINVKNALSKVGV